MFFQSKYFEFLLLEVVQQHLKSESENLLMPLELKFEELHMTLSAEKNKYK